MPGSISGIQGRAGRLKLPASLGGKVPLHCFLPNPGVQRMGAPAPPHPRATAKCIWITLEVREDDTHLCVGFSDSKSGPNLLDGVACASLTAGWDCALNCSLARHSFLLTPVRLSRNHHRGKRTPWMRQQQPRGQWDEAGQPTRTGDWAMVP